MFYEEFNNLNAAGILGVCFIVLHILGYITLFPAILGGLLVVVTTYSMYRFHQDIAILAYSIGYQTAMMMEEEPEDE